MYIFSKCRHFSTTPVLGGKMRLSPLSPVGPEESEGMHVVAVTYLCRNLVIAVLPQGENHLGSK